MLSFKAMYAGAMAAAVLMAGVMVADAQSTATTSGAGSTSTAGANGCAVVDPSGSLWVFGSTYGDFNLGAIPSAWTNSLSSSAMLSNSSANRPPFVSSNLLCIRGFFLNYVYFLNADPANPNTMHVFDFGLQQWGPPVTLTGKGPSLQNTVGQMDHDTSVIYLFGDGQMWRLGDAGDNNLVNYKNSPGFSLAWIAAANNAQPFDAGNYVPTMAQGWINYYLFGINGVAPGSVYGFRIHYGDWGTQPQPIDNAISGLKAFPTMHGKTTTLQYRNESENTHDGAPAHIVYIPDDYSGTYIIDSYINVTRTTSPPPSDKTSSLTHYAADLTRIIQFTPDTGALRFADFAWLMQGDQTQGDPGTTWQESQAFSNLPRLTPGSSSTSPSGSGSSVSKSGSGSTSAGGSQTSASVATGTASTTKSSAAAGSLQGWVSWGVGVFLGAVAFVASV